MKARYAGFIFFLLQFLLSISCLAAPKVQSLCQFHYPSDYLYEWNCVRLTAKDSPSSVFGRLWQEGLRFNRMDRRHFVAGLYIKVPRRMQEIKDFTPMPPTYPEASQDPQFILVDQNEMFLGAYEFGELVFSAPVAVGVEGLRVQNGNYQVDAVDPRHESSLYPVEGQERPYPMHYALRFYVDKRADGWTSYWLHGRDIPGYPASHGCIGLYDEEMQKEYYHSPTRPVLMDAKRLYLWALAGYPDTGEFQKIKSGPRVLIMGDPPQGTEELSQGFPAIPVAANPPRRSR